GLVAGPLAASTNPKPILAGTGNVLWSAADDQGAILQVQTGGGLPDLMRAQTGEVLSLAQDIDHIYWGTFADDGQNGQITMAAADASNPRLVAGRQATPTAML